MEKWKRKNLKFKINHQWQIEDESTERLIKIINDPRSTHFMVEEAQKAVDYLDTFNDEYYNGRFDKAIGHKKGKPVVINGEKVLDKKGNELIGKGGEVINKTKKQKKECYDKVNSSNRDLYSILKPFENKIVSIDSKEDEELEEYTEKKTGIDYRGRKLKTIKEKFIGHAYDKSYTTNHQEDLLIEIIDTKKEFEKNGGEKQ